MTVELDVEVVRGTFRLRVATTLAAPATGVIGPSGAGKSTLLSLIAGLVRPTSGRVVIAGEVVDDVAAGIHVPVHRRRVGVVFQHGHLFPHLSVLGNLRYGMRAPARAAAGGRAIELPQLIELLELGPLLGRRPRGLSGGERQRVALGRALLAAPRVLLLDEPLASLDHGLKRQIMPFLRRLQDDVHIPVIHVSHELSEVLCLTQDLLVLERGGLVARGIFTDIAPAIRTLRSWHDLGMANALRARVVRHDPDAGLTTFRLAEGAEIHSTLQAVEPGSLRDLLIGTEEVLLARERISGISAQNQLAARVVRITAIEQGALAHLDIGTPFLVAVSRRSLEELAVREGDQLWCLFKAHAVRVL
jgi:molybdate transport system ATP-binding protein